jgi:hypothetical protein
MLTSWAGNVEFAPTHSEGYGSSPKYVLYPKSWKVCPSTYDIWFWNGDRHELDNAAHPLLASTVSAATPQ